MARKHAIADLAGGVAGAAVYLALVFGMNVSPWLAIPIAVMTYGGMRLLRSEPPARSRDAADHAEHQRAYTMALANLAAMRKLEPRIAKPGVRLEVERIGDAVERVLRAIKEDDNLPAATPLVEQILAPCEALLTEYVRLSSRGVASAEAIIEKTETQDLALILQTLDDLFEALHRTAVIDLAVLSEMIELNRGGTTLTLPRRIEP